VRLIQLGCDFPIQMIDHTLFKSNNTLIVLIVCAKCQISLPAIPTTIFSGLHPSVIHFATAAA